MNKLLWQKSLRVVRPFPRGKALHGVLLIAMLIISCAPVPQTPAPQEAQDQSLISSPLGQQVGGFNPVNLRNLGSSETKARALLAPPPAPKKTKAPTPTLTSTPTPTATHTPTSTPTPPAVGTTFNVTKTEDTNDGVCDADCSLREAIRASNSLPDADTIVIPAGIYELSIFGSDNDASAGDLDITEAVTLAGDNAQNTIITGSTGWDERVFHTISSGDVEMRDLTITGGTGAAPYGAGIRNMDTNLSLIRVIVDNNTTSGMGGGIYVWGGSLTLVDSAVTNNVGGWGGGILNDGATINLTNSTISGNSSDTHGGGISNLAGNVTLLNVTITNNIAGADFRGGNGGGVYNTTVSTAFTMKNTLIANNSDIGGNPNEQYHDCYSTGSGITSQGHNLIGTGYGCTISSGSGDQIGTKNKPIDPQLGPLQDNGGNTLTHELLSGSPAIDAGDNNGCPAADQRGFRRDAICDIGAFELHATPPSSFAP